MQLTTFIRLCFTFYKSFILLSLVITGFCLRAFWLYGFASFFGIFWCKIASLAATLYFVDASKKREYYYYLNLGVSRKLIWLVVLGFDLLLFILFLILISHFK